MLEGAPTLFETFEALSTAASVYKHLPDATVAVQSLDRPILNAKWHRTVLSVDSKTQRRRQKRNIALALVAYFDSGTCDLDPSDMDRALAVSSGDSIYVPRQVSNVIFLLTVARSSTVPILSRAILSGPGQSPRKYIFPDQKDARLVLGKMKTHRHSYM
jgi:hypothetical protein